MVDDSLSLSLQTWLPIKQTEAKRLEGQEKVFRVADMLQEKAYSSLVSVHGLHSTELEKVDQDQESPPWKKMYRWEFWGPVMTPEVANSEAPGCQKQNENVGEWGVISIGSAGKRQPPPPTHLLLNFCQTLKPAFSRSDVCSPTIFFLKRNFGNLELLCDASLFLESSQSCGTGQSNLRVGWLAFPLWIARVRCKLS